MPLKQQYYNVFQTLNRLNRTIPWKSVVIRITGSMLRIIQYIMWWFLKQKILRLWKCGVFYITFKIVIDRFFKFSFCIKITKVQAMIVELLWRIFVKVKLRHLCVTWGWDASKPPYFLALLGRRMIRPRSPALEKKSENPCISRVFGFFIFMFANFFKFFKKVVIKLLTSSKSCDILQHVIINVTCLQTYFKGASCII